MDDQTSALIESVFGGLIAPPQTFVNAIRQYHVERSISEGGFRVSDGINAVTLEDADSLLFHIEEDITLTLQYARRDLFFVHAAAVALEGRVAILAAASGTGKSTLTLASLAHGLEYLSDELAPVDIQRLTVHPYPHALCLKSPPPPPYSLPARTLTIGQRFHLPVDSLPNVANRHELPLVTCIFLQRGEARFDGLRPITTATGVARLMSHALNPLAHPGEGLDAAVALSQAVPSFDLDISDATAASGAIKAILSGDRLSRPSVRHRDLHNREDDRVRVSQLHD